MYDIVNLLPDPDTAKWLTVGDGRYGTDSIALRKRGIKNVLPSDISEYPLKCALERNLITDYAVENAEKLSFADDAFDYVMCKEAYHHFPRPYIALYEMLRVAKQAVLLIEPNDYWMSPLGAMAFAAKRLLGRARHVDDGRYEDSGNYVYSVSQREMEKLFWHGRSADCIQGLERCLHLRRRVRAGALVVTAVPQDARLDRRAGWPLPAAP